MGNIYELKDALSAILTLLNIFIYTEFKQNIVRFLAKSIPFYFEKVKSGND